MCGRDFTKLIGKVTANCFLKIMQGGISSGYKKSVEENGLKDETYSGTGIALVHIHGTSIHNNKTLQVDAVLFTPIRAYVNSK
jgi:hypothetical protein